MHHFCDPELDTPDCTEKKVLLEKITCDYISVSDLYQTLIYNIIRVIDGSLCNMSEQ